MIFVFDSSSLINMFRYYYYDRFPSLWEKFHILVKSEEIISVREVFNEIEGQDDALSTWAKNNRRFFPEPIKEELEKVADIFRNQHFQSLVNHKTRLKGRPVADPFIIAKAKTVNGSVITEEAKKEKRADIPNVCEKMNIPCFNFQGFMQEKKWRF